MQAGLKARALALFERGDFEEARGYLSKTSDSGGWIQVAANTFLQMREYRIAEYLYSKVIETNPNIIMAYAGRGACAFHLDRISEALRHIHRAITMLITYELRMVDLGTIDGHGGNPIWQTSIPVKGFLVYGDKVVIGDARLSMIDRLADAEFPEDDEQYTNIIMPEALFHFAAFCRQKGRHETAITCLKLLLRLKPDDTKAQTNLGTALAESGDLHQALAELGKALDLDPDDAVAYSGIGKVYALLGNRNEALRHFTRAIELREGDYPFAQEELRQLRSGRVESTQSTGLFTSVFVSYASEDKSVVVRLADDLNKAGIDVWLDEWAILPGDSIVEEINKALESNRYFLPVLSTSFLRKPWPKRELQSAMMKQAGQRGHYIIPVLIEKCKLPAVIADIAYANLLEDYNEGLRRLVLSLKRKRTVTEG
jgi:tetratricopeptide (TPR) repeat protein